MTCGASETPISTFVFSVGGTILDSIPQYVAAWQRAVIDEPLSPPSSMFQNYVGLDDFEVCKHVYGEDRPNVRMNMLAELTLATQYVRAFPEAAPTLRRLAHGGYGVRLLLGSELNPLIDVLNSHVELSQYEIIGNGAHEYNNWDQVENSNFSYEVVDPSATCFVSASIWELAAAASAGMTTLGISRSGVDSLLRCAGATNVVWDVGALRGYPSHAIGCRELATYAAFV